MYTVGQSVFRSGEKGEVLSIEAGKRGRVLYVVKFETRTIKVDGRWLELPPVFAPAATMGEMRAMARRDHRNLMSRMRID